MKKKAKYLIVAVFILFLIQCGGGSGSSTSQRQLVVELDDPSSVVGLSGDEYQYLGTLYAVANGEQGDTVFGPVELASYNADENQYYARIDNVLDGNYFLEVSLVKMDSVSESTSSNLQYLSSESYLSLSSFSLEVSVSGTETNLDLTGEDWDDSAYDDDEDGLSNLYELSLGTDPSLSDSDGDGVLDSIDAFPINASESFDFDGDGLGDENDNDIDNDGLTNSEESELGTSAIDDDTDDDGVLDGEDNCPIDANDDQTDTDGDGFGDECDDDADGDGIHNDSEDSAGTDKLNSDTDGDGVADGSDAFPTDATESTDNDGDGIGDNADTDDDNDGLTDSEEAVLGTDSNSSDTDGDGIDDNIDNCPSISNPGQGDNESDGVGDSCDADDDNDGLSDEEEAVIGEDGFITNDEVADSDGDGFNDDVDNCPNVYNVDQTQDADGDGFGTDCDCDDSNSEIHQLASDSPDSAMIDSNCDGIDGNKYEAVFVSADGSADASNTDPSNPTDDVQAALNYASSAGYEVYFLEGDYNVTEFDLVDGISLFGGFSNTFLSRDITGDIYPTNLIQTESNDESSVLTIIDFENELTVGGFNFINQTEDESQYLLYIENSSVNLENNKFAGNEDIQSETLVYAANSTVDLTASQFYGESSYQSFGLDAVNSSGTLKNNIFSMGDADHTKAILLDESDFIISNNTIDGGNHSTGTAYGIIVSNSVPVIINNIFITENDRNQASIYCDGAALTDEIELKNNLFLRYTTKSYQYSAYVECNGTPLSTNSDLENSDDLDADDNIVDSNTSSSNLANILDMSNYYDLVSGSLAIDIGMDADDDDDGGVFYDFNGNARTAGSYDIGAHEF